MSLASGNESLPVFVWWDCLPISSLTDNRCNQFPNLP